jgi:hypothetical protein
MYESQNVGADVARALGFNPKEFIEINLRFRAGDLLVVTTEQLVTRDQNKRVTDEIVKRKFFVSEIEDENAAPVAVPAKQPPKPSAEVGGYRRRVTPEQQAPTPAAGEGWVDQHDLTMVANWLHAYSCDGWKADVCNAAAAELERLRSEVERLRLTENHVNTLERIAMLLKHHGIVRDAAEIAAIAKRHGGGE